MVDIEENGWCSLLELLRCRTAALWNSCSIGRVWDKRRSIIIQTSFIVQELLMNSNISKKSTEGNCKVETSGFPHAHHEVISANDIPNGSYLINTFTMLSESIL